MNYDPRLLSILDEVLQQALEEVRICIIQNVAKELGIDPDQQSKQERLLKYKDNQVGTYTVKDTEEGCQVHCKPLRPVLSDSGPFGWLKGKLRRELYL